MQGFAKRVVERFNELDARVRALERKADEDTTLADLRTSMEMLTDAVKSSSRTPPVSLTRGDVPKDAVTRAIRVPEVSSLDKRKAVSGLKEKKRKSNR